MDDDVCQDYEPLAASISEENEKAKAIVSAAVPIQQAFENCRFARDSPKAKEINNKITECIALVDQPFSVLEDQGFCR